MRRALCLLVIMLVAVAANAQHNQDFASKFMKMNKADSTIRCVTVSPKMMMTLQGNTDENHTAGMRQAVSKLKSARIVTAADSYFDVAVELLRQNANRFSLERDFRNGEQHWAFYKRASKRGNIVELIMLQADSNKRQLTIVNLTGNLDDDFIRSLTQDVTEQEPHTE